MSLKQTNLDSVIAFAATELKKGLCAMQVSDDQYEITLGLLSDFGIPFTGRDLCTDDEISVSVHNGGGHIAGSNPRSVLFAVYRYLEACGVAWVRPGKNGTLYPKRTDVADAEIHELASTRYRSVCIEGADSLEHILDMIDWMPKLGFNSYYIQFRDAFIFFDRWYSHRRSPLKKPEPIQREQAAEYVAIIQKEIKKRGLFLEAVGHGWTCEPFGVPHSGWDKANANDFPQEYVDICAMVNGKRHVWNQTPLQTQVCMSNPEVRKKMNEGVIAYIKENPAVDVIYYWLGDYFNNTCECNACRELYPSDYNVRLMNELDEAMTEQGLHTRIVFSTCYNLANPPLKEQLNHPDRFEMMFAPITRTYSTPFPSTYTVKEIPEYQLNQFENPVSTEDNLAYLYAWKQYNSGAVRLYDYHLMWDHQLDAGNEGIARILHEDITRLQGLGIDGFTSCQLQRNAFPTAIAMHTMGKTLWNTAVSFESIRVALYGAAFGQEYVQEMEEYLGMLSSVFDIGILRSQKNVSHEIWKNDLVKCIEQMRKMEPVFHERATHAEVVQAESWRIVELNSRIFTILGQAILLRLEHRDEEADKIVKQGLLVAWEHEDELQLVLDCFYFEEVQRTRITLDEPKVMPELGIDF